MSATAREDRPSALETSQHPEVDDNVLAELPAGSSVLSVLPSGASAWVHTVRIDCRLENGEVSFSHPYSSRYDRCRWLVLATTLASICSATLQYLYQVFSNKVDLSIGSNVSISWLISYLLCHSLVASAGNI